MLVVVVVVDSEWYFFATSGESSEGIGGRRLAGGWLEELAFGRVVGQGWWKEGCAVGGLSKQGMTWA
jgi:hypothetical protein